MKVIQHFMNSPLRNYNYIIYSEKSKEAIFVDPFDIDQTLPICEQMGITPKYLLNTHSHHDHIKDNEKFLRLKGVSEINLKNEEVFYLSDSESLKSLYTPGHIDPHYCFLLRDKEDDFGFISGDVIFNAGIGNCKNGGDVEVLYETITFLNNNLLDSTKLYPSHDYLLTNLRFSLSVEPDNKDVLNLMEKRESQNQDIEFINTNIEIERRVNPFFRLKILKEMERFKGMQEKELFIHLRGLRDKF